MKIRDGIKLGIGFTIVKFTINLADVVVKQTLAKDDEYMEREKDRDPEWYEELLKYRKH